MALMRRFGSAARGLARGTKRLTVGELSPVKRKLHEDLTVQQLKQAGKSGAVVLSKKDIRKQAVRLARRMTKAVKKGYSSEEALNKLNIPKEYRERVRLAIDSAHNSGWARVRNFGKKAFRNALIVAGGIAGTQKAEITSRAIREMSQMTEFARATGVVDPTSAPVRLQMIKQVAKGFIKDHGIKVDLLKADTYLGFAEGAGVALGIYAGLNLLRWGAKAKYKNALSKEFRK